MLSKNKVAKAVMGWAHEQFADIKHRGSSLIDENGGDSIRINSARQSGTLLFLDLVISDGEHHETLELCLKASRQEDSKISGPSPSELSELDGTA